VSLAKFSLKDCNGVEHEYEVERFSVDEQADLQLKLGEPLMKALARTVAVLAPAMKSGGLGKAMQGGNLGEMAKALSDARWSEAADILTPLPKMIMAQGGPKMIAYVFSKTVRLIPVEGMRGQPTVTDQAPEHNMRQHLGDAGDRDLAFGEGNMGEYWRAAGMVLLANFTPPGPNGYVDWKRSLSSMTGGLLVL
jgi:hypothetical protein